MTRPAAVVVLVMLAAGTAPAAQELAVAPEPTVAQEPQDQPAGSRAGLIEQEQARKAASLTPAKPTKVEAYVTRVYDAFLGGQMHWHAFFQNAYSGGGFTLGAGYLLFVSPNNTLDLRGSITPSGYKRIEAEFIAPGLFGRRATFSAIGGWREATQVGFYGFGMTSTVDARAGIGLGDDESLGLPERLPHAWRQIESTAVGRTRVAFTTSQDAECRGENQSGGIPVLVVDVIANAEEREVVVHQPSEKCDGFVEIVDSRYRSVICQLGYDGVDLSEHDLPVVNGAPNMGECVAKRDDQRVPGVLVVDPVHMDLDQAFPPGICTGSRRPGEGDQPSLDVALDIEPRVHHEMRVEPLFRQFGHHGIDQKRHVIVDDFDDRYVLEAVAGCRLRRNDLDLRSLLLSLVEELPRSGRDLGYLRSFVARQIFRCGLREYLHDEIGRRIGNAVAKNSGRVLQDLTCDIFILQGLNRRTETSRPTCAIYAGIVIHTTTSLIRGADCSGNCSSGRWVRR